MKEFMERLVDLVENDKELHDATVRLLNTIATLNEEKAKILSLKGKKNER
ncbi:MAG: hypothetical protein KGI33_12340 [Thaumarchaeota archaeon]|nr:hypothetical protein [Nitrososphaerota archaeon]